MICNGIEIIGVSYAGNPASRTAMYITKKVAYLIDNLVDVYGCLVFIEYGVEIFDALQEKHHFVYSKNPSLDYNKVAVKIYDEIISNERALHFKEVNGSHISVTAKIGEHVHIEPGCFIGPDTAIGDNTTICSGTRIKHTTIGKNAFINENVVIGTNGLTMTIDEYGNKMRIPMLGRVLLGDNVEIGANSMVSAGAAGDTILEDNVKLDGLVHIGHDAHLCKNVEVVTGGICAGFSYIEENVYVSMNASIRNRTHVGRGSFVGMGAAVTHDVEAGIVVAGVPAKKLRNVVF